MRASVKFLFENSAFLIIGAFAALLWANLAPDHYHHLIHVSLWENPWIGHLEGEVRHLSPHFIVNEMLMAVFFAIAGKEVWEATLPGGPLSKLRLAAAPLIATVGGMLGPIGVYLAVAAIAGDFNDLAHGWAVPTATDIAFSYLVARVVFGAAHPAIPFLLLLAIADDALGLIIIAVFYPQGPIELPWLLLSVAAVLISWGLRRARIFNFWPYLLIAGALSWFGFFRANLHPALGLLPIIPLMPHSHSLDWQAMGRRDTLNAFEHWWKHPVEIILGGFGLFNAGVVLGGVGTATTAVALALIVGKPLGIYSFARLGESIGIGLPRGMKHRDLLAVGFTAAIGFTVAIFVTTVAFAPGAVQDAAKIGALGSFGAAFIAIITGRLLKVERRPLPAQAAPPPEEPRPIQG